MNTVQNQTMHVLKSLIQLTFPLSPEGSSQAHSGREFTKLHFIWPCTAKSIKFHNFISLPSHYMDRLCFILISQGGPCIWSPKLSLKKPALPVMDVAQDSSGWCASKHPIELMSIYKNYCDQGIAKASMGKINQCAFYMWGRIINHW